MHLTVAALQTGNYEGRGAEYLAKLFDGIRRHMPRDIDLRCVCFTDDATTLPPGVQARGVPFGPPSWWQKLAMFRPGAFEPGTQVLYFDLDTIILGDLGDIARYRGDFAMLNDPFFPERANSSLMSWTAGKFDHVWTAWEAAGRPQFDRRGDQFWIETTAQTKVDRWQDMLPGQIVSFKADCWLRGKIPDGARVMVFHGQPRPHNCAAGFVRKLWNRPQLDEATAA
jgi:hypothetical protein